MLLTDVPKYFQSPDANSLPSLCSPGSLPEDELAFMTLNMEDDLDMSMRAPYISMSESAELPMLMAEDLMWGAQPDLKQSLNICKKMDLSLNNQSVDAVNKPSAYQQQKSTFESSLASLLCNQIMQHQQQLSHGQQLSQSEQQVILNSQSGIKIQIMDQSIATPSTLMLQDQETRMGLLAERPHRAPNGSNEIFSPFVDSDLEWTMNDLLQIKKPSVTMKSKCDEQSTCVSIMNQVTSKIHQQTQQNETIVKSKEKSVNHKRPSLSHEISNSKRARGQETIKATPQLLQQLMTTTGCNQKSRTKSQVEPSTSKWSPAVSPQKTQQSQPASNSVLMNLLVSGCDVSAGYYTCLPRPKVAKA